MGLILCKWLVAAWYTLHPFYVSVTEIRHDAAQRELEISCRIFSDDLERALKAQYKTNFDIIHPADRKAVDAMITDYLNKHLHITVDGKPVTLHYLGYQIEEEAAWCFLDVKGINTVKKVHVSTDILYAQHPEQINMLHVIVKDERKSDKLDNPEREADFQF
ncbi:hypothetical protein F0L74_18335 [Chitinophaga agrisoli]|uniref:Uncharacterized protein n=1 Tax=Chitinophaga agrisoli TaxID=2607653 RepID=A0A5B2VPY5_9BACT|nr:DUF6702 family protein [Chitinophaga agrisoli]KAA2241823.1 hypothetical protein F0L74_18335 [Chitinophaga agrisoli]